MAKFTKSEAFGQPNDDKFDFAQHARELDARNDFSPLDVRGLGLRTFIERSTRTQSASSGTHELVPEKLYLQQQSDGSWVLLHAIGRGFDRYPVESQEQLIQRCQSLLKEN